MSAEVLFKCLVETLMEEGGFNLSGILTCFLSIHLHVVRKLCQSTLRSASGLMNMAK